MEWILAAGKKGPSLGNESPKRRIPFPAFFSPGRGVIHPSFPLRGRWERPSQISKQAPSPSLRDSCRSSFGMRPLQYTMQLGDHFPISDPGSRIPLFLLLFRCPASLAWASVDVCQSLFGSVESRLGNQNLSPQRVTNRDSSTLLIYAQLLAIADAKSSRCAPWQLRTVNIRKHFDTFPGRNRRKPAISLDALESGSTNSSRSSLMPSGYRDCCRAQALGLKLSERLLEKSRPLIELDPGAASGISQDGVTASRIHVF